LGRAVGKAIGERMTVRRAKLDMSRAIIDVRGMIEALTAVARKGAAGVFVLGQERYRRHGK